MRNLNVLFVGGTGVISSACSRVALDAGMNLTILTRGSNTTHAIPQGVESLVADVRDFDGVRRVLRNRKFDVVVQFVGFKPEHVEADIELFSGSTTQYIFVSSAAAYQTPPLRLPISESTPLRNPYWEYARDKIACEELLQRAYREKSFPVTIVRPSHTYDRTSMPLLGGWTNVERMRAGKPVVVHGDGAALWVLTNHMDVAQGLVGLFGNPRALGEIVHITSDEILSWSQIFQTVATAAGVDDPDIVSVPSREIVAINPSLSGPLFGDRTHSVFFDNSKIKSLVPGFSAKVRWAEGARGIVEWHDSEPGRRRIHTEMYEMIERLISLKRNGG